MNRIKGKLYKVLKLCNPTLNINIGDTIEILSENDSNIVEAIDKDTNEWFIIDKTLINNYFQKIENK